MDALRVQTALQGYALPDPSLRERERVWYSLVSKRRRAHLAQTLQLDEAAIDALIADVRQERTRRRGRSS
jgi:hypothetical protein